MPTEPPTLSLFYGPCPRKSNFEEDDCLIPVATSAVH